MRTGDDENELHRLYARQAELTWYFPPEVMARSGVMLGVGHDGLVYREHGLIRNGDRPAE